MRAIAGVLLRLAPDTGLRMLLGDLSTLPAREVWSDLRAEDRPRLIVLFSRMRSGRGFNRPGSARRASTAASTTAIDSSFRQRRSTDQPTISGVQQ